MAHKVSQKIVGEFMNVDPQFIFQRWVLTGDEDMEDPKYKFKFELCSHPSSMFDSNGLPREANKPALANKIRDDSS